MRQTRTHSNYGPQVLPSEERRRSQRVMIRVPVTLHFHIAKQALTVQAETVAVNDHGALLLCSRTLDAETSLEVQNEHTRRRVSARVTRVPRDTAEGFLIPVEFDNPSPGFWQISFPPTDWKPMAD